MSVTVLYCICMYLNVVAVVFNIKCPVRANKVTLSVSIGGSGDGEVPRPCDPGQPFGLGSLRGAGQVQGHALPALQQGGPSGKGLSRRLVSVAFLGFVVLFFLVHVLECVVF